MFNFSQVKNEMRLIATNYWENLKRKYQRLCGKQQEDKLLPYHPRAFNFRHVSDLTRELARERDTATKVVKCTGDNLQGKAATPAE